MLLFSSIKLLPHKARLHKARGENVTISTTKWWNINHTHQCSISCNYIIRDDGLVQKTIIASNNLFFVWSSEKETETGGVMTLIWSINGWIV